MNNENPLIHIRALRRQHRRMLLHLRGVYSFHNLPEASFQRLEQFYRQMEHNLFLLEIYIFDNAAYNRGVPNWDPIV